MTFDFRAQIEELAGRVRESPSLELLALDLGEPISEESIANAETRLRAPLPAPLRELYGSLGSATLRWRFRPDLDEATRERISEEFSLAVTRPNLFHLAGAIDIVPLDEVLFDEENALPQSEPDEGEFDFGGAVYSDNDFARMLRPFDLVNDFFAMALVVQPDRPDWKLMWLSDYWIEYDSSRVTYLEDYLRYVIATWGLINARDELFSEHRGDRREPLRYDADLAAARVPTILRA